MLSRRSLLSAALALATLAAFAPALAPPARAHDEHPEGFHAHNAYARITGTSSGPRSGAVFFTFHNNTQTDELLIGARTEVADVAELHTHTMTADGVMQMGQIEGGVPMPWGEMHAFQRGGDHVMLMGLSRDLKQGDIFPLTLIFASGQEFTLEVVVDNDRAPDAGGMEGMDHSAHGASGG